MEIIKAQGITEPFNSHKLIHSLMRAGATQAQADMIAHELVSVIKPHDTTSKIFREAFKRLVVTDADIAARYSLPRALAQLGPAGYIFEQYIEILLQTLGYQTKQGIMVRGTCLAYEVDVYAEKAGMRYIVEAKYRNDHHIRTHLDQVMYAHARFLDIKEKSQEKNIQYELWVITNTRFTESALRYARCKGFQLLAWNYPKKNNLETMIRKNKLYPITLLPTFNTEWLARAVAGKMLLAQDVLMYTSDDISKLLEISKRQSDTLLREARTLVSLRQ